MAEAGKTSEVGRVDWDRWCGKESGYYTPKNIWDPCVWILWNISCHSCTAVLW